MNDEDFDPFVGGPPPDPSERTWRHPSEVAAQANADESSAGDPAGWSRAFLRSASLRNLLASGPFHRGHMPRRPFSLLLVGSLGAAACLTTLAVVQNIVDSDTTEAAAAPTLDTEVVDLAGAALTAPEPTASTTIPPTASPTLAVVATTAPPSPVVLRAALEHIVPVYVGSELTATGVMFAGYLLTSASAIGNQLSVGTTDEGEPTTAYLVGVDPFSDLAVYRPAVETRTTRSFETIATASALDEPAWPEVSTDAERTAKGGDPVSVAAFADNRVEIATGTIIATDQRATTPGGHPLVGLIDTTVRRPDRSAGSLLLTNEGHPVGIVVDSSSSLASAVPINDAVMIANRLAERGWANATWIGFIGMDHDRGVEVVDVTVDGPAAEGGLRPGDIIAFFDGAPIEDMGGVTAGLRRAEAGDIAILVVERAGKFVAVRVTTSSYETEAISESIGG